MKKAFDWFYDNIWRDPVWSKVISAAILTGIGFVGAAIYKFKNKWRRKLPNRQTREIFNFNNANTQSFFGYNESNWANGKRVGNKSDGNYTFENSVLQIQRQNTDGKFVIKLVKYVSGSGTSNYIASDSSRIGLRIIRISFQAKVFGGSHLIWFVTKKLGDTSWIGGANVNHLVTGQNWSAHNLEFRVVQDLDLEIYIHDESKAAPSSVQIKDLIIQEDI
jgi:hypothetical protein